MQMKFRRKTDLSIEVTRLSSLIDRGVEIVGDVCITDGLRIDGHVRGEIRSRPDARGLLVLTEHGSVDGSVKVHDAVINGTITGDLSVEHFLELQAGARVCGNITYRKMRMECGASVDGRLECLGETQTERAATDNVVSLPRARPADA
jgi:cytoskeletal protein CcmA (bactofilin family)